MKENRLSFKNWPFSKNEPVKLLWICSPHKRDDTWMLSAVFQKQNGDLVEVEVPWGTLPFLRIGEIFRNKVPSGRFVGKVRSFGINSFHKGTIIEKRRIPYIYRLNHSEYYQEKCWSVYSKGKRIVVPCIELVRKFFTPYQSFANQLLKPNGFQFIVDDYEKRRDTLYIKLSRNFPINLIGPETVRFLAWLMFNPLAKSSWDAIFQDVFKKMSSEPSSSNSARALLEVSPPLNTFSKWKARVVETKNTFFVLELLSASGLFVPFKKIIYEHDELVSRRVVTDHAKLSKAKRESMPSRITYMLDSKAVSQKRESRTIKTQPVAYMFSNNIKVIPKKKKAIVIVHESSEKENPKPKSSMMFIPGSTGDYVFLKRKLPALEPEKLKIEDPSSTEGLKKFLTIIKHIVKRLVPKLEVKYNIISLPQKGRYLCRLPDGAVRKCVIARIGYQSRYAYVIEVDRTHINSLSTLIIIPLKNQPERIIKKFIYKVLERLVDNNGWDYDFLDQNQVAYYRRLWHVSKQPLDRWAERILNAAGFYSTYLGSV